MEVCFNLNSNKKLKLKSSKPNSTHTFVKSGSKDHLNVNVHLNVHSLLGVQVYGHPQLGVGLCAYCHEAVTLDEVPRA